MVTGEELRVPKAVKEAGRVEQSRLEEVDKIKGTRRKGNTRVINYHSFGWTQGVHLGEVRGPRQGEEMDLLGTLAMVGGLDCGIPWSVLLVLCWGPVGVPWAILASL